MPKQENIDFADYKKIEKSEFDYNIKNFYMTDVISRSSETMARCTNEILEKVL